MQQAPWTGQVVSVPDGDSLDVVRAGRVQRVRLYGIDCPEAEQPFGERARDFTASLVHEKRVRVVPRDRDIHDRIVADVFTENGSRVNTELVAVGLAWWYRKHAPHDAELKRLEAQAQQAARGLWSDPNAIPPWQWREP